MGLFDTMRCTYCASSAHTVQNCPHLEEAWQAKQRREDQERREQRKADLHNIPIIDFIEQP